jgi:alkaline phosphatase D
VWITADVHYPAAHHYHPQQARFTSFTPFWELVAGPLHAAVFGPNPLDATFGPEVMYERVPAPQLQGVGPASGMMSFGTLSFDPGSRALAVELRGGDGATLWSTELRPA